MWRNQILGAVDVHIYRTLIIGEDDDHIWLIRITIDRGQVVGEAQNSPTNKD